MGIARGAFLAGVFVFGACVAPAQSKKPTTQPTRNDTVFTYAGAQAYGSRKLSQTQVLAKFDLPKPGTVIDMASSDLPQRVGAKRPELLAAGIASVRFSFAAMEAERTITITMDLVDQGDEWRSKFTPAPTGAPPDPSGLLAAYAAFQKHYWSTPRGNTSHQPTDLTCANTFICMAGYDSPEFAEEERHFREMVPRNFDALAEVLRTDAVEEHRMAAINLLGFQPERARVVKVILPFIRDSQVGVRNEVLRALGSAQNGTNDVIIPLKAVLDALWMPELTDRNKAGWALVRIVDAEGQRHVKEILERDGEVLVTMAGMIDETDWQPAVRVLQSVTGQKFGRDREAWRRYVEKRLGRELNLLA